MLQASVTYNTTEYSNSTIENVSAPLSGKYGQVIMFVESPISSRTLSFEDLLWPVWKWQHFMTFLVLPLHSWFQYWAIRRFKIDPRSNSASTFQSTWRYFCQSRYLSSRWVLRVPFPAQDITDQLCNHKFSTIFFRYFCCYPRNCWNYFGSARYFGFGKFNRHLWFLFQQSF